MPEFAELLRGYRRFREEIYPEQRDRFLQLEAEGQHPKLLVISCSDSRVEPAQIFDVDPGEIFVVRNVAALVPPAHGNDDLDGTAAAVEFAVGFLKVRQIVVLGHSQCGGCKAALTRSMEGRPPGSGAFIDKWTRLLSEARANVKERLAREDDDPQRAMEYAAVQQSLANLRTYPWVSERERSGELVLRGAHFQIADGMLTHLDQEAGEFEPIP